MARTLTLAVTGLAWAVMMSALFHMEVIPYFQYQAAPTYRTMLNDRPDREFVVRSIHMGSEVVGQTRSMFYPGHNGSRQIFTEFDMSLKGLLQMMGLAEKLQSAVDRISITSHQVINAAYQLESFRMNGQILMPLSLEGKREGDTMKIRYQMAALQGTREIPFEKMAMLGGAYTPLQGIGKPKIGKMWKVQMLEPNILSGEPKVATIFARIEDKENIRMGSSMVPAYRIEFRRDVNKDLPDSRMWVDEEGEVLVEEIAMFNLSCRIILEKKELATPEQVARFVGNR